MVRAQSSSETARFFGDGLLLCSLVDGIHFFVSFSTQIVDVLLLLTRIWSHQPTDSQFSFSLLSHLGKIQLINFSLHKQVQCLSEDFSFVLRKRRVFTWFWRVCKICPMMLFLTAIPLTFLALKSPSEVRRFWTTKTCTPVSFCHSNEQLWFESSKLVMKIFFVSLLLWTRTRFSKFRMTKWQFQLQLNDATKTTTTGGASMPRKWIHNQGGGLDQEG